MLACKGIFARTSITQTVPSTVSGTAAKADEGRISAIIIQRSKNACLQGHFCEDVNNADRAKHGERHRRKG
jgi:hypothetical protein